MAKEKNRRSKRGWKAVEIVTTRRRQSNQAPDCFFLMRILVSRLCPRLVYHTAQYLSSRRTMATNDVTNGSAMNQITNDIAALKIAVDHLTPAWIAFGPATPPVDRDFFSNTLFGTLVPLTKSGLENGLPVYGLPVNGLPVNGQSESREQVDGQSQDPFSNLRYKICSAPEDVDKDELPMIFLTSSNPRDPVEEHLINVDALLSLLNEKGPHVLVYAPVTTSSHDVLENLLTIPCLVHCPIIVVAGKQVAGRGRRSQRVWESPSGCAMFSFNVGIGSESRLGSKLGFIQHLMVLSIVRVLKSSAHNGKLNLSKLRIKWPNDLYYGNHKIAGIIVTTSLALINGLGSSGQVFNVCIGIGINVNNTLPTTCINSIFRDLVAGKDTETDVTLTIEEVISKVILEFDQIVHEVQNWDECVFYRYKDEYIENWMHTNQVITHCINDQEMSLRIKSVDDQGFLMVEEIGTGKVTSLVDIDTISLPVIDTL